MTNPWKLGIIGLAVAGVTAFTSGLTTAYLMRPAVTPGLPLGTPLAERAGAPSPEPGVAVPGRPVVRTAGVPRSLHGASARAAASVPSVSAREASEPAESGVGVAPATPSATNTVAAPAAIPPVAAPAPMAASAVPEDCATGGSRAWRIAKPGAVGGLVGAGAGAVGGAIADGGKGAGKGAMIGGLAGAALGSAWGAYKTKNECGTIFGEGPAATPAGGSSAPRIVARTPADPSRSDTVQTPFSPAAAAGGITVYGVR